jgi:DUF971 family protein
VIQGEPWPTELRVRRASRSVEIDFDDGTSHRLPAELLRALTPSAADRGHGAVSAQPLARRFEGVGVVAAQAVGAYAVRLVFDDGHDTGLYTWSALYRFCRDKEALIAEHDRLVQGALVPPS